MIEDCESKGYAKPRWVTNAGVTTLTFSGVTVTAKTDDAVNDVVNDVVNDAVNDAVNEGLIGAVNDAVNSGLSDVATRIYNQNEGTTIKELIDAVGKSHRTIQRYLQILKTINFVEFRGAAKTGRYFLTDNTLKKIKRRKGK